ncbi:MAG TPA: hypothetical protein VGP26_32455 [Actinophytocola sp.]|nr:hypothetical protein [Actinophytocola sp.]
MICPHCSRNLLYKQRGRRRCTYCRQEFAFEPKTNKLHLHDMKIRKFAERLSDKNRLRYTVTQLWYGVARKQLADRPTPLAGCGCGLLLAGVVATGVIIGLTGVDSGSVGGVVLGVAVVVVLAYVLIRMRRNRLRREAVIRPAVPLGEFRDLILRRWAEVYRGLPSSMIDEDMAVAPAVAHPRVALVCPDRSVLACLGANGVPQTFAMALAMSAANLPPGVPVVVMHDASAEGCRFAAQVRAAVPGRVVVDAGLRPSAVMRKESLLRLRRKPFSPGELAGLPLTQPEVTWLAQGWWSPVAAIGPVPLLAAVTKAVQRAQAVADPEHRRAERLGFLTWPAP